MNPVSKKVNSPESRTLPGVFQRLQQDNATGLMNSKEENPKQTLMNVKVSIRPSPFATTITLDVSTSASKHVIVRLTDEDGRIVRMFGWYLMKGINITSLQELKSIHNIVHVLDILDQDGTMLYNSKIIS